MNTQPSTPFGKFFERIGIWRPSIEDAIEDLYNKLHDNEKKAVQNASGWIAIINANLQATPDFVFNLIQKNFPGMTKENITDALNKLNAEILKVDANTPDDLGAALSKLQDYLSKYQGNTWIAITRAVVAVLSDILMNGTTPIQKIETVLEFVYRTFIKDKVAAKA
jgi:hypothetical protein